MLCKVYSSTNISFVLIFTGDNNVSGDSEIRSLVKLGYEIISGKSSYGELALFFIVVDLSAKKIPVNCLTNSVGVDSCLCHLLEEVCIGLLDYKEDL